MRLKNRALFTYGIIIAFLSLIFALVLYLFLEINSKNFTREFYSQNYRAIEAGDSFSLIPQLNSLLGQNHIQCIQGLYSNTQFFSTGSECGKGLISRIVKVEALNKNVQIIFEYRLSKSVLLSVSSIFLFTLVFSTFAIMALFHIQKLESRFLEAYNTLAVRVGHDIRSPLSALSVLNSIADLNTPEARNLLSSSTQRINSIAKDLLYKGRNPSETALKFQAVNVLVLIAEIVEEKKAEFRQIDFKLNIEAEEVDLVAETDRAELSRILSNIINNSVEAREPNRELSISISVRKVLQSIEITINDNGKGIPKKVLKQLGKIKETTRAHGFGIGTYYAFEIIKRMKGSITYQSELGKGTSVHLRIPIDLASLPEKT